MRITEKRGLSISIIGAFILGCTGIGFSFFTGSQAVLLDGLFNFIAAATVYFGLRSSELLLKPATTARPAGYVALEPLYVLIKGIINAGLNIYVVFANLTILLNVGSAINIGFVVVYIGIAITGSLFVYTLISIWARQEISEMLNVEKDSWKVNVLISGGIGLAFLIVLFFKDGFLSSWVQYVDQVVVILIGALTLGIPIKAIKLGGRELLLLGTNKELQTKIEEVLTQELSSFQISKWEVRIIKTGRKMWVTLYIVPSLERIASDYPDKINHSIKNQLISSFSHLELDVIITNEIIDSNEEGSK